MLPQWPHYSPADNDHIVVTWKRRGRQEREIPPLHGEVLHLCHGEGRAEPRPLFQAEQTKPAHCEQDEDVKSLEAGG